MWRLGPRGEVQLRDAGTGLAPIALMRILRKEMPGETRLEAVETPGDAAIVEPFGPHALSQ